MFADDLRKSILQAAIQGKLSKQLTTDGDARALLRDIQAEKSRIIKEKKIKPAPPLPPISPDEIPFEIPQNWCWARLGDIFTVHSGQNLTQKQMTKSGYPVYGGNGITGFHDKKLIDKDSLVIGRVGFYCGSVHKVIQDCWVTDNALIVNFFSNKSICTDFFVYLLNHINLKSLAVATAQPVISGKRIYQKIIPLPPLAEQKRIAEKVSALLEEIAALAEDEKELAQLEKEFPRKIKASLLQAAIQGKLSKQLPTDGDARALLREIRAEKLRLVKAKKIKAASPLPPISPDEIPFEIPQNWCWARLGNICEMYTGNSISEHEKKEKYLGRAEGFDFIATKDISFENEVAYNNGVKIPFENNFKRAKENSILLCIEGGSAGRKIARVNREVCFGNKLCNFTAYKISNEYLYFYLQSPTYSKFFNAGVVGIIGGVGINKLKNFIVPLPPLAEQKRIVARLEELLTGLEF